MDLQKNINIRLVKCVEKYPILYNNRLKAHYNRERKEEAWIEIATDLHSTPDLVKQKWKRLRSVFNATLKQLHMGAMIKPYYLHEYMLFLIPHLATPWDPERRSKRLLEESEKVWAKTKQTATEKTSDEDQAISDYLQILEQRQQSDNSYRHQDSTRKRYKSTDSEKDNYPPRKEFKRSKLKPHQKHTLVSTSSKLTSNSEDTEDYDPKTHFLLSLLPDVEELNNAQMRLFKAKVLSLINEILDDPIVDET